MVGEGIRKGTATWMVLLDVDVHITFLLRAIWRRDTKIQLMGFGQASQRSKRANVIFWVRPFGKIQWSVFYYCHI